MRTPKQIANLRRFICTYYDTAGFFLTDEEIDAWADKIQNQINIINYNSEWEIRVRTNDTKNIEWADIEKEPKTVICSLAEISVKASELLEKYHALDSILIRNPRDFVKVYIFERDKNEEIS